MSSEDAMGGSAPPLCTDAQEARAPAAGAGRPVRVLVSPAPADGSSSAAAGTVLPPTAYSGVLYLHPQRHDEWWPMPGQQQRQQRQCEDEDDPKKVRAKWFDDMRGWLMVVAVQVASVTYQAGLNPPDGFGGGKLPAAGESVLEPPSPKSKRYYMFFYFNSTAFVTSLAIIVLLMNRSFYASEARVVALEIVVVLDVVGLMGAYWAGSTSREDQTTKYTLVLTAFVLFALYVVYMVQLLPKLLGLAAAVAPRRAPADDDAARGRDDDAALQPVPSSRIDEARPSQRPQGDVGRSVPRPRRRGSRSARALGTEPARMLSP